MKIINLVFHVGRARLDAVVESAGKRRKIEFRWFARDALDVLPDHWVKSLIGETAYQEEQDRLKEQGRYIPS